MTIWSKFCYDILSVICKYTKACSLSNGASTVQKIPGKLEF